MYPWGALEQIRTGQMGPWPPEDHEALRVAASVDPMVLVSADAFDRLGSLLTVLRVPLWRLLAAFPVVVLAELEDQVKEWGVGDTLEALTARVRERAGEDVVSPRVLARALEVERTRKVIDGDLSGLEPVEVGDEEGLGDRIGSLMLLSCEELSALSGASGWSSRNARRRTGLEPELLAWAAVRMEARKLVL
jgi:hypothetical protein